MNKKKFSRRQLLSHAGALGVGAALTWGFNRRPKHSSIRIPEEIQAQAQTLMDNTAIVDLHSHPGRFFLNGLEGASWKVKLLSSGFEDERIADMAAGQVTASAFSVVSDIALLDLKDGGIVATRDFNAGEAYADYQRQLAVLKALLEQDKIQLALKPEDITAAQQQNKNIALFTCEGADFVEAKLERLAEAYEAGVRSIGLVHYKNNAVADNQTSPPVHGGLSALGREMVVEMNRQGLIVDLAHASLKSCEDALAVSTAPVMVSHSNLLGSVESARFLTADHANLIAQNGGLIGAWPSGLDSKNLWDFAHQVLRLVEQVGIDHVSIGTDMDGNYKPVLRDYIDYPSLTAMLLYRGLSSDDCQKILSGNFLRLFSSVLEKRSV